jgi:hypothetical protein
MFSEAVQRDEAGDTEWFAELVIRATLGAINANAADERVRGWHFEKTGIAMMTDEQAQQSFDRWKSSVTA